MDDEESGSSGVEITDRAFVVDGQEIPLGDVVSVRLVASRPAVTWPVVTVVVGAAGLILGGWMLSRPLQVPTWRPSQLVPGLELLVVGFVVLWAGGTIWRRGRTRWKLLARTREGERTVLTTTDHALAERVLDRIEQARAEAITEPGGEQALWPA